MVSLKCSRVRKIQVFCFLMLSTYPWKNRFLKFQCTIVLKFFQTKCGELVINNVNATV